MKNLFKGNNVSLIACGLILSSSFAFGADTVDAAFKEGKVSGSLIGYSKVTEKDDTLSTGNVGVTYETASFKGLSGKVGFFGSHVFEEDDANSDFDNSSIMTEANLTYTLDKLGSVTAGRQAIDLEWMGDYHEAVVAAITAIPDTTIVLGYSDKKAVAAEDEISSFEKFNGTNGAYVADVKYVGLKSVEFNPYYYSAPDLASWYGLKTTFTADMFGALAHYAASDEETQADASMLALELSTSLSDISLAAGYIMTDKDGGVGSMTAVGDNYEPMDDGSAIYMADAKMVYGSVGYEIAGVALGALYSQTKINSDKENELNLTVGYSFTDSLSTSLLYADIDTEINTDKSYGSITVAYAF